MLNNFNNILKENLKDYDLSISDEAINKMKKHASLLLEANEKLNLTRISSEEELVIKHYLDSILVLKYFDFTKYKTIFDVGSGGGFPGIPLKACLPGHRVVLIESIKKKTTFLRSALGELWPNDFSISASDDRFEKYYEHHKCDVVIMRAVASVGDIYNLIKNSTQKKDQEYIFFKGPKYLEEINEISQNNRIKIHSINEYQLPKNMGTRVIIHLTIKKACK